MFPIELRRRRDRNAGGARNTDANVVFLLTRQAGRREVVACACRRARAAGVRPGMPLGEARALLPDADAEDEANRVRIEPESPERDRAALESLAVWAQRFSPVVAVDAPDGLLIDATGCARLFKGENRLLRRVRASLARLGFQSRVAIGPTNGCARAVARFGNETARIVANDGAREAIAPLSTAALDIDEKTTAGLSEVGIDTIGQLLAVPRSALRARFDETLLLRLDQALGDAMEMMHPARGRPAARRTRV